MKAWLTFHPTEGWELWFFYKPFWAHKTWLNDDAGRVVLGDEAPEGWRGETYTRRRIWPVTVRVC